MSGCSRAMVDCQSAKESTDKAIEKIGLSRRVLTLLKRENADAVGIVNGRLTFFFPSRTQL